MLIIANIGTAVALFPVLRNYSETAGAGAAEYLSVARALVALHEWTFLLGPGLVVGIGNGLLLGFLMYRSHLVLRPMALLALIGGPLMSLSGIAGN